MNLTHPRQHLREAIGIRQKKGLPRPEGPPQQRAGIPPIPPIAKKKKKKKKKRRKRTLKQKKLLGEELTVIKQPTTAWKQMAAAYSIFRISADSIESLQIHVLDKLLKDILQKTIIYSEERTYKKKNISITISVNDVQHALILKKSGIVAGNSYNELKMVLPTDANRCKIITKTRNQTFETYQRKIYEILTQGSCYFLLKLRFQRHIKKHLETLKSVNKSVRIEALAANMLQNYCERKILSIFKAAATIMNVDNKKTLTEPILYAAWDIFKQLEFNRVYRNPPDNFEKAQNKPRRNRQRQQEQNDENEDEEEEEDDELTE